MITPFTAAGGVDHDKAWRLARWLSEHGSDGLVVAGTTGESPTLTSEEKVSLFGTVVESVENKDTRVLAGTGTNDTAESIELSKRAADVGVDGVMAVTPYYSKPEQNGLRAHFEAIADATELPLIVYNIPGRTARLIEIETLAALAEHPKIVATKDAVMDLDFTSRTAAEIPGWAIYSGQDSYTWPMMAVGAVGVVSVISHLAGDTVAEMVAAAAAGDVLGARELHARLLPLSFACFVEANPGPLKAALSELWEEVGQPRLPLSPAGDETVQGVLAAVSGLQVSV